MTQNNAITRNETTLWLATDNYCAIKSNCCILGVEQFMMAKGFWKIKNLVNTIHWIVYPARIDAAKQYASGCVCVCVFGTIPNG